MQSDRDLLKQALEALEWCLGGEPCGGEDAVRALRERLAQPEQEPAAVRFPRTAGGGWTIDPAFLRRVKHSIDPETHDDFTPDMEEIETTLLALEVIPANLYTTPPRREWRGLSDDNLEDLLGFHCDIYGEMNEVDAKKFAADIEKRLKEKNA